MTDFIPRSDAEFKSWEANFVNYLTANLSQLGLTPEDLTMLTNKQGKWQNIYSDHIAKQAAAESVRQDKIDSRKDYESLLRSLTKQLQANPKVTDGHKAALKIRVPQTVRTRTAAHPEARALQRVRRGEHRQLDLWHGWMRTRACGTRFVLWMSKPPTVGRNHLG